MWDWQEKPRKHLAQLGSSKLPQANGIEAEGSIKLGCATSELSSANEGKPTFSMHSGRLYMISKAMFKNSLTSNDTRKTVSRTTYSPQGM